MAFFERNFLWNETLETPDLVLFCLDLGLLKDARGTV